MTRDEFRPEPNLGDGDELDFSGFHPLDHSFWACKNFPGGRRQHLTYRWDFQWRGRLRAATLCRLGLHDAGQAWQKVDGVAWTWTVCTSCGEALSSRQPE